MYEWTGPKPIPKEDRWKFDAIAKAKRHAKKCLSDPNWLAEKRAHYNALQADRRR